jgi:Fe-S cluster assembly protein SufD
MLAPAKTRAALIRSYKPDDFPPLTGREEEWRFTPLRRLRGLADGSAPLAASPVEYRAEGLPAGVTGALVPMSDERVGAVLTPFDRPSAEAFERTKEALVVSVARDTQITEPVFLELHGEGAECASYGHLLIEVAELAEVTIVLRHSGEALLADNVEVSLGAGAQVTLVTLATWGAGSVQLTHHRARIAQNARLVHISVALGGEVMRQYVSAEFAGRGAEFEGYGVYFADGPQHFEHRLLVDHAVPDCRSHVNYRGALQGEGARTVWVGDVLIQAAATGTDTYEVNRNLLLSDGARADSIPNLEIETGEIAGAGHASATGRFDDEQLFYLQARGIPEEEARRLVVRGFFAELLAKIPVEAIRTELLEVIEARLTKAGE